VCVFAWDDDPAKKQREGLHVETGAQDMAPMCCDLSSVTGDMAACPLVSDTHVNIRPVLIDRLLRDVMVRQYLCMHACNLTMFSQGGGAPSSNNKIINPCKPYLSASATAPHPLGRRKAD
jgi:hypothetical protein